MLNTQIGCWWMLCCSQVSTNNLTAMKLLAFNSLTFVRTRDHRRVFCTDAWRRMTRKRTRFAVAKCSETSTDEMTPFSFFLKNTISLSHRKRKQHQGKDTDIDLDSTRPLQPFRYRQSYGCGGVCRLWVLKSCIADARIWVKSRKFDVSSVSRCSGSDRAKRNIKFHFDYNSKGR